jgi:hypothetical protein
MMTEPDDARRAKDQTDMTARDRLRKVLLTSGLSDWVPLIEVITAITHYRLAETFPAQQDLALRTIQSEDGLVQTATIQHNGNSQSG